MLARIRKAVGREGSAASSQTFGAGVLPPPRLESVMPTIAPPELLNHFEAELAKVDGVPYRAASISELVQILTEILKAAQADSVVLSRNPLLAQLGLSGKLSVLGKSVAEWPSAPGKGKDDETAYREACFTAPVGITGADWALAETGSLVLTSQTEGSQLASLAPPVHVALYRRSQLLASLDDVLERLPLARESERSAAGRSVVFVTGVSRTADIEQILIRGVHGPRELHAILIEESCLDDAPAAGK
jgi:L-lactate dehydrogenase complex protein LldG